MRGGADRCSSFTKQWFFAYYGRELIALDAVGDVVSTRVQPQDLQLLDWELALDDEPNSIDLGASIDEGTLLGAILTMPSAKKRLA